MIIPERNTISPCSLEERVKQGILVDSGHLREMAKMSKNLADRGAQPTVFRTLERIFSRVADSWEEFPLSFSRKEQLEKTLGEPISDLMGFVVKSGEERAGILLRLDKLTVALDSVGLSF